MHVCKQQIQKYKKKNQIHSIADFKQRMLVRQFSSIRNTFIRSSYARNIRGGMVLICNQTLLPSCAKLVLQASSFRTSLVSGIVVGPRRVVVVTKYTVGTQQTGAPKQTIVRNGVSKEDQLIHRIIQRDRHVAEVPNIEAGRIFLW